MSHFQGRHLDFGPGCPVSGCPVFKNLFVLKNVVVFSHHQNWRIFRNRPNVCGGLIFLLFSNFISLLPIPGGPGGPRKQKVIALPEVTHITCTSEDFMVLCCDGVFEGNFSNEQVCQIAKPNPDPIRILTLTLILILTLTFPDLD